jgi:hypothetical protein
VRPRLAWAAIIVAVVAGLFTAYLLQSRTQSVNADGASNALQAWDMLHGNWLLRGWTVSDVSFYTTELPQYALIEAARGLSPDVIHVAAAMTYTLLVLLAAWLAKGRATGREGLTRALIAAGIMLAPSLGDATYTLLLSPDHVGTGVPVLVTWIIVDRGESLTRRRWLVPVAACLLLAWAEVGDPLVEVIAAAPLAAVCAMRVFQGLWRRDGLRAQIYYLSMTAAALLSVGLAWLAVRVIVRSGGWTASAVPTGTAPSSMLGADARLAGRSVLELFGADFFDARSGLPVFFTAVHVAGLILVACGYWLAVRRFFGNELLVQLLSVAIVVNMVAYMFGVKIQDIHSTREIAAVLSFSAVLAGRQLAGRLLAWRAAQRTARRGWLAGAGAVTGTAVLAGYAAMLGFGASQGSVLADNADLSVWLAQHGLTRGLSGYWQGNSVTVNSGNKVQLYAIVANGHSLQNEAYWEAKKEWYEPSVSYANFLVTASSPHAETDPVLLWNMKARAGRPAHVYEYGRFTIAVWDKNLLTALG